MKNIQFISNSVMGPKFDPMESLNNRLVSWLMRPRIPVLASEDSLVTMFIEGMITGQPVHFIYIGGSKPGSPRVINVSLVFRHHAEGRIYIAGYCQSRAANRVFSLDLAMVVHAWICNGREKTEKIREVGKAN